MNVAVCLCGQFRTAYLCKENIVNIFLAEKPTNIHVDFFAHTWTYTKENWIEDQYGTLESKQLIAEKLVSYFNPKAFKVDEMPDEFKFPATDGWRLGQYYSISESFRLRQEYEKETGIEYDFVFFCRFDQLRIHYLDDQPNFSDYTVNWKLLPPKEKKTPIIYDWFRKFEWETWGGRTGFWILADFSWFCNKAAADLMVNFYSMYRELCSTFRGDNPKVLSNFWTQNVLYEVPEKYFGIYCFVNDILVEEDKGVYLPGWPVRKCLVEAGIDLNSFQGRKVLASLIYKYGFRYTAEQVNQELPINKNLYGSLI